MGVTQMEELETSGNMMSKRQEKTRRTSGESSRTPKVDQPSCLRGAFICLFLKRTEHKNREDDPSTKNQNTEGKEGVRRKKRRVVGGSIFRLPCLRPAESTVSCEHCNDFQDKIEEQSNQVIAEEELKPYSKASFLRKIRGYRLMRERDTTEKEKVIEITQFTHGMESVEVKEHREQKSEKVLDSKHKDMVEEKWKVMAEQECPTIMLGGKGHNLVGQDGHAGYAGEMDTQLRKQESPAEKLREQGKDLPEEEVCVERAVNIGKDQVKQESHAENVEKVEKLGNFLQKQESHANGEGGMEKHFLEEDSGAENLEDLGSELVEKVEDLSSELVEKKEDLVSELVEKVEDLGTELVKKVEDLGTELVEKVEDLGSELVEKMENLGSELVEKVEDLGSETNVGNYILELDSHAEEVRKEGDDLPEQDSHAEEVGNNLPEQESQAEEVGKAFIGQDSNAEEVKLVRYDLPKQDSHAKEMVIVENNLPEQDINVKMEGDVGKDLSVHESHGEIAQVKENHLFEWGNHAEKVGNFGNVYLQTGSHAKKVGEQGNSSQDTFYVEKVEEPVEIFPEQNHEEIFKEQEKNMLAKGSQSHKVGESGQNVGELPQTSSVAEDGFRGMLIQEGANLYQGFVPSNACQEDSYTSRTLGENGELDTTVRKKCLATNTASITIQEEPHTQLMELQEKLTPPLNTMDLTYQQQENSQKGVSEDDAVGCESTDWGSLKEEVTDMVQWLVEEASDRLDYYTQESHGTG